MHYARDELAVAFGTDQRIYAIGGFGGPKKYFIKKNQKEIIFK